MQIIRQVQAVLWSFVGLGRRKDAAQLNEGANPLLLILIAFVLVLLFLGTLALVAHAVVPPRA